MKTALISELAPFLLLGLIVWFMIWVCFIEGPKHPWPPRTNEGPTMIYIPPQL